MRPCGTKSRAPNRYTRKELDELAKKNHIQNISKKTMDELCKELKLIPSKQKIIQKKSLKIPSKQKITQKKTLKIPSKQKITVPPLPPKVYKKCNPKDKNAFRPSYTCNPLTGRWNKQKGSFPYHFKYQLQSMNVNQLQEVAKKLSLKLNTKNKQQIIKHILEKQYPLVKGQKVSKNVQLFKQKLLKLYKLKKKTVNIQYYNNKLLHTNAKQIFSSQLVQNPINLNVIGVHNMLDYKTYLGNDIDGLVKNQKWFHTQRNYQNSLPFLKQLLILNYTLRGDRVANHRINNVFNLDYFFNLEKIEKGIEWSSKYIFPLYPIFIYVMTTNYKKWWPIFSKNVKSKTVNKTQILRNCGISGKNEEIKSGSKIFDSYTYTIMNIFRNHCMTDKFYNMLAETYVIELNKIILASPPLENNLIVYKGVRQMDYLKFNEKNTYTNKQFISTSFNSSYSLLFPYHNCCMQKIFLLKGTKVLFPVMSYFTEYELILPPNRLMYAVSKPYTPINNNNKTINLVITN